MAISHGIMTLWEYKKCISYKATCGCCDPNHDLIITIELDEDSNLLSLIFSTNVCVLYNRINPRDSVFRIISDYFGNIKFRIKKAFEILFKGQTKMETEFILDNEENIKDFIKALNEGYDKIKSINIRKK